MKTVIKTPEQLQAIVCKISASKLPVVVEVKKYVEKRSLNANALFHKWCGVVSKEYAEATGKYYTPEMWKEYFKQMFGVRKTIEVNGTIKDILVSTAEYDVEQMSVFMTNVDHFCGSELHIFLPNPRIPEEY